MNSFGIYRIFNSACSLHAPHLTDERRFHCYSTLGLKLNLRYFFTLLIHPSFLSFAQTKSLSPTRAVVDLPCLA